MRSFRMVVLIVSAVFLIASCGSGTTTAAVEGIKIPSKVKVL
jgi:hypothetical protein